MEVFLLAGQSNMQGFGKIAGYPVLYDDRIFNLATGHAEPAVEPLHDWAEHHMPEGIGLGLPMPFALEVLKAYPDIRIGFIPSARGGSHLDQWLPGKENFERAVSLYERARKNIPDCKLAGILWHQGEADAARKDEAETYGSRFIEAIKGFRNRLGGPDAPVVAGEMCRIPDGVDNDQKWWELVTEQTREAVSRLGNAAYVSSEGLSADNGEHLHFNTPSIRKYGLRYAAAYLKLTKKL